MFRWFKNVMLVASVYCLSAGGIYFSIVPASAVSWVKEESFQQALWLALPLTILVIFVWSKVSKKFGL